MDGEAVIGVLPNLARKKGFLGFGRDTFNVVLTQNRIIFALLTSQMIKDEAQRAREEAKARGDNIFKKMWNTATAGYNVHKRYPAMAPDAILAETAGNFVIDPNAVTRMKYKNGGINDNHSSSDIITFEYSGAKLRLETQNGSASLKDARSALVSAYGERFK